MKMKVYSDNEAEQHESGRILGCGVVPKGIPEGEKKRAQNQTLLYDDVNLYYYYTTILKYIYIFN